MSRILLVDDEPLILEELKESLELEGLDVETAGSVDDAIGACNTTDFDAIVTDLKMPNGGGVDLLNNLKVKLSPIPVIVVSGHASEDSKDHAIELGASACFNKPVDVDTLLSKIEEITSGR